MSNSDDGLRESLLRLHSPDPEKLATHRKETEAMLEREERRLRFLSRYYAALWIMVVAMGVAFGLVAGWSADQPVKVYFTIGLTLMMLLIGGAVQLVSSFILRARLEVTKDIKGLELKVMELETLLRDRSRSA